MDKLGRERGLIAYATLSDYADNMALATGNNTTSIDPARVRAADGKFIPDIKHFDWRVIFRPRTLLYSFVWSVVGLALLIALLVRDRLELNVLHDRNPQYVVESDGSIRNGYMLHILNMVPQPRDVRLDLKGLHGAVMSMNNLEQPPGTSFNIHLDPDQTTEVKVFVTVPKGRIEDRHQEFHFQVDDPVRHERDDYKAEFFAPEKKK
jgi:polyferredoxin